MKWLSVLLVLLLSGCASTAVVYEPRPVEDEVPVVEMPVEDEPPALKTGLAMFTDISDSEDGKADYDVVVAAVTVDEWGVIQQCIVERLEAEVEIDGSGALLGEGEMERREEAVQANYAVGKTAEELTEGDWQVMDTIAKAAKRSRALGASETGKLRLAVESDLSGSVSATENEPGRARLDCNAMALTLEEGVISSCRLDGVRADVNFNALGALESQTQAPVQTKTELGEQYGMKRYGGAKFEWYEQAENFCRYVTGKTAAQVAATATVEGKPAGADLVSSVTISIHPFQALVARACGE